MKLAFAMPHLVELAAMVQPWERGVTGADQTRLAKLADELGCTGCRPPGSARDMPSATRARART